MLGISERLEVAMQAVWRVVKVAFCVVFCAVAVYHGFFLLIQWAEMYPGFGGPL